MPNNNPQQSSSQQSSQRSEGSQKISERVERTADQASRLADRLGETAEQTANAALQRVRDARMQAQSGLAEQRTQIAERIRRLGGVLRAGSETLSTDDPYAHNLLTTAGDRVERLATYVEELEPSRIAEDLHGLARRRPGLFFGGAFLIGLGLGRFVKSSGKVGMGVARDLSSDRDYGDSSYDLESESTYERGESGRSYVATQRDIGVGAESPTTGTPSYGSTGASGTTLPYGVGGSSGGTGSSSSYGTSGTSGSGTSGSGTSGSSMSGSGTSGSSSAFGSGTSSEGRNTTGTSTPRETDRGQGSKS